MLNANAAGCAFAMIALVSLGQMQDLFHRVDLRASTLVDYLRLALAACGVLAALCACALTGTRSSLLLSVMLGVAMVAMDMRRHGRAVRPAPSLVRRLLLVGASLGLGQIYSRWGQIVVDARVRGQAYAHYLSFLSSSPWFGAGLGSFRQFHEAHLTVQTAPTMWDYGAAHSALLQALIEGGWPFVILLTAALALVMIDIGRAARRVRDRGPVLYGMIAAVALAGACSFLDIALNVPAVAALASLLLGAAWGATISRRSVGAHGSFARAEPRAAVEAACANG